MSIRIDSPLIPVSSSRVVSVSLTLATVPSLPVKSIASRVASISNLITAFNFHFSSSLLLTCPYHITSRPLRSVSFPINSVPVQFQSTRLVSVPLLIGSSQFLSDPLPVESISSSQLRSRPFFLAPYPLVAAHILSMSARIASNRSASSPHRCRSSRRLAHPFPIVACNFSSRHVLIISSPYRLDSMLFSSVSHMSQSPPLRLDSPAVSSFPCHVS